MKFRIISAAVIICATLPLAGCDFLTPNWDALKPTDTPSTAQPSETPTPTAEPTKDPDLELVNVVIFSATADSSGIDVVAQVQNVSESGGTCRLVVTQPGTLKEVVVKAEANVTDSQCFPMHLPLTGFDSGPATYQVTYLSDTSFGESSVDDVVIP